METGASRPLRLLAVQPDANGGPDRMARWAADAGIDFALVEPDREPLPPDAALGFDGLVVFGGAMGDMDTERFPWLEDIREVYRVAARHSIPTLGICLGAQLLASSLGGRVERGSNGLETGVVEVTLTTTGREDPLMASLPATFPVGAMHYDAIDELPPGATLLASGTRYPRQAFRIGNSWGVQFHPEVSPDNYEHWVSLALGNDPDDRAGLRASVDEFRRVDSAVEAVSSRFFHNFFRLLGAGA